MLQLNLIILTLLFLNTFLLNKRIIVFDAILLSILTCNPIFCILTIIKTNDKFIFLLLIFFINALLQINNLFYIIFFFELSILFLFSIIILSSKNSINNIWAYFVLNFIGFLICIIIIMDNFKYKK